MFEFDLKTALDIGLGAISLALWWQQQKINQKQVKLDAGQNAAVADLTKLVREHDSRITALDTRVAEISNSGLRAPKKRQKAAGGKS